MKRGVEYQMAVLRGREKILAFVNRGIRINRKPNFMRRAAAAVKRAIYES